jgi:hypothetical protein
MNHEPMSIDSGVMRLSGVSRFTFLDFICDIHVNP